VLLEESISLPDVSAEKSSNESELKEEEKESSV
jgi:hypothetical protein